MAEQREPGRGWARFQWAGGVGVLAAGRTAAHSHDYAGAAAQLAVSALLFWLGWHYRRHYNRKFGWRRP